MVAKGDYVEPTNPKLGWPQFDQDGRILADAPIIKGGRVVSRTAFEATTAKGGRKTQVYMVEFEDGTRTLMSPTQRMLRKKGE